MKREVAATLAFALAASIVTAVSCSDSPTTVCPAILYFSPSMPDTTTIKAGASTIAIAGATWGGCETGPPPPDFVWKSSDSSVVSVVAFDSIHARIQGLRPGKAIVTPTYRSGRPPSPVPVAVTGVP